MNQEAEPLKYLPWIGAAIVVVFWGASQVVLAYAGPVCRSAGEGAEVSRGVRMACPAAPAVARRRLSDKYGACRV